MTLHRMRPFLLAAFVAGLLGGCGIQPGASQSYHIAYRDPDVAAGCFLALDRDHNALLSFGELGPLKLTPTGGKRHVPTRLEFAKADANADGVLDRPEFVAWLANYPGLFDAPG